VKPQKKTVTNKRPKKLFLLWKNGILVDISMKNSVIVQDSWPIKSGQVYQSSQVYGGG
jgi:hypothetical protein